MQLDQGNTKTDVLAVARLLRLQMFQTHRGARPIEQHALEPVLYSSCSRASVADAAVDVAAVAAAVGAAAADAVETAAAVEWYFVGHRRVRFAGRV